MNNKNNNNIAFDISANGEVRSDLDEEVKRPRTAQYNDQYSSLSPNVSSPLVTVRVLEFRCRSCYPESHEHKQPVSGV